MAATKTSTTTRKRTRTKKAVSTKKKHVNLPTVETSVQVLLYEQGEREKHGPSHRFAMKSTGNGLVRIERQSPDYYNKSEWEACDETYTFQIEDLEQAIKLVKNGG